MIFCDTKTDRHFIIIYISSSSGLCSSSSPLSPRLTRSLSEYQVRKIMLLLLLLLMMNYRKVRVTSTFVNKASISFHWGVFNTACKIFLPIVKCERIYENFKTMMVTKQKTTQGRIPLPNRLNFWKSAKRGGGYFQSKNLFCRFWEL